jgi:hypothetical protein
MAIVTLNPILERVRGEFGDLVFKHFGNEVVISHRPDFSGVQPTEAQLQQRERFRQAVLYGQLVMADPQKKAIYTQAVKAKGKPLFSLTVADFFNAPSVDEVDLSAYAGAIGDIIAVRAHDDFDVERVHVSVTKSSGEAIESGEAVETPLNSGRWVYLATAAVPQGTSVRIAVSASDRPGSVGQGSAEKTL